MYLKIVMLGEDLVETRTSVLECLDVHYGITTRGPDGPKEFHVSVEGPVKDNHRLFEFLWHRHDWAEFFLMNDDGKTIDRFNWMPEVDPELIEDGATPGNHSL